MAKTTKHLDDMALRAAISRCQKNGTEGRFACGPGLSCVVTKAGRARFVHRYPFGKTYKTIWLDGVYPREVTLAEARRQCEAHRELLDDRIDPQDARKGGNMIDPTLAEYARSVFELLATPKDVKLGPDKSEWLRDMTKHTGALADMKIDSIVLTQIKASLAHRWKNYVPSPSAKRIVGRLRRVLSHRHTSTRPDDTHWNNPANFEALCDLLGRRAHRRRSRASLAWRDAPEFFSRLQLLTSMSARVLEWVILTGCRSAEATGARWSEIEIKGGRGWWVIPAARLKTEQNKGEDGAPFVVPLSLAMVQLLRRVRKNRDDLKPGDLIFPSMGVRNGLKIRGAIQRPKPNRYKTATIWQVALSLNPAITVHGFRSTLVAWGSATPHREREPFALDLMDRVIGHQIGSKEGQAAQQPGVVLSGSVVNYAHDAGADLYLPRRKLVMREWSAYLTGLARKRPGGKPAVVASTAADDPAQPLDLAA
jgi:integrase